MSTSTGAEDWRRGEREEGEGDEKSERVQKKIPVVFHRWGRW